MLADGSTLRALPKNQRQRTYQIEHEIPTGNGGSRIKYWGLYRLEKDGSFCRIGLPGKKVGQGRVPGYMVEIMEAALEN